MAFTPTLTASALSASQSGLAFVWISSQIALKFDGIAGPAFRLCLSFFINSEMSVMQESEVFYTPDPISSQSEQTDHAATQADAKPVPVAIPGSASTLVDPACAKAEFTWTPYQRQAVAQEQQTRLDVTEEIFGRCLPLLSGNVEKKVHEAVLRKTSVLLCQLSKRNPALVPNDRLDNLQEELDGVFDQAVSEAVSYFRESAFGLFELPNMKSALQKLDSVAEEKFYGDLQSIMKLTKEITIQTAKNAAYDQVCDELDEQLANADKTVSQIQEILRQNAAAIPLTDEWKKCLAAVQQTNEIENLLEKAELQRVQSSAGDV